MPVSSLLLWDPALRDREASTFFQRLQRDPLLILQILALLALDGGPRAAGDDRDRGTGPSASRSSWTPRRP